MHYARILAEDGLSQDEIATRLGVSDRMVRKYLKPDFGKKTAKPTTSLLDPYKDTIMDVIEESPFFNLVVLFKRIQRQGYLGSMTILRVYAAKIRAEVLTKAVRRFESEPGRQAQVDWKECGRWFIDGVERKVYAFVMVLGFSRKPFVWFTTSMTSPVLLAAHTKAFEYFQGVPCEILYDNMKTAWVASSEGWNVNGKLLEYAGQVGFKPLRCKVRRPQTKGKVERFIGYLGNHFLPEARARGLGSLEDLNAAVMEWLAQVDQEELREFCETRSERFEQESSYLRPWVSAAAPDIRVSQDAVVSREATVTYETNRYSVPAELIGRMICIRHDPLGRDAVIYHNGRELYAFTLLPAGSRGRLIRPQDALSLRQRWERENRHAKVHSKQTQLQVKSEIVRPDVAVETRSPKFFERLLEGA
jgi:transposase